MPFNRLGNIPVSFAILSTLLEAFSSMPLKTASNCALVACKSPAALILNPPKAPAIASMPNAAFLAMLTDCSDNLLTELPILLLLLIALSSTLLNALFTPSSFRSTSIRTLPSAKFIHLLPRCGQAMRTYSLNLLNSCFLFDYLFQLQMAVA